MHRGDKSTMSMSIAQAETTVVVSTTQHKIGIYVSVNTRQEKYKKDYF